MSEYVDVAFSGEGSGRGPLTWGQLGVWRMFEADGESKTMGGAVAVPPDTPVELIAESLRYVMGRHQALRTRLHAGPDGTVEQEVAASGTARLELVDVPAGADPDAAAEEVRRRYAAAPWDYAADWPIRMAMLRQEGRATHVVAVYLHSSLDARGLVVLVADLMAHLRGEPTGPVTALQPLELAAKQSGPHARRQTEMSMRHMEHNLLAAPLRRFPDPVARPSDWDTVFFRSPALRAAVDAVAARRGIDTSPVLLAAYALGLASETGVSPVAMWLAVSNRFRPRLGDSVSPLAQVASVLLDVADGTLDDVVGRAWQAALGAYKHAYYHPAARSELTRRIGASAGGPRDLSCYFNDRRGQGFAVGPDPEGSEVDGADLLAVRERTTLWWDRQPGLQQEIAYLDVDELPGAIQLELTVDVTVLTRPATERLLRRMEEVVIDMARSPDTPTGFHSDGLAV